MSKKPDSTLKCAACEHENEPERVYCHNCGSKLDRSILPKTDDQKTETAEATRSRVKKMMNPKRGGASFNDVKIGIQVIIFAVIVAAMFLFWQAPDDIPEARKDYIPLTDPGERWEQLIKTPSANMITLSEDDANIQLRRTIKGAEGSLGIKFVRAVVSFEQGMATVIVQRDAWGLPMYSSVSYKPVVKDGKVRGEVVGIRLGRLGIAPALGGAIEDWAVTGICKVFEKEIKQSDRLAEIRVEDGQVKFISKAL